MGRTFWIIYMSPAFLTTVASLVLAGALVWLYFRLAVASRADTTSADWWEQFSPDRYLPMKRLLRREDFEFLSTLPGYHPSVARELRRQRMRIFRAYLEELRMDFRRLQSIGQAMLIAGTPEPGLPDELFRQRVRFARAYWRVRFSMLAWRLGLGEVEASALVEALRAAARPLQTRPQAA